MISTHNNNSKPIVTPAKSKHKSQHWDDVRQTELVITQGRPRTADKCPTEIDPSGTTSEKDKESKGTNVDPAGATIREETNTNCFQLMQEGTEVPKRAIQEIDQGIDQRSSTISPMTILA